MGKLIDLSGQRFGRLTVLRRSDTRTRRQVHWACECECGASKSVSGQALRSGATVSCGCFHRDNQTNHGMTHSSTYTTWESIIQRTTNARNPNYPKYGGAGIGICPSWREFGAFLGDMGLRPDGTSIDRIDNACGYHPGNCRWASRATQSRNRTNSKLTSDLASEIRGRSEHGESTASIAARIGVSTKTVSNVLSGRSWA